MKKEFTFTYVCSVLEHPVFKTLKFLYFRDMRKHSFNQMLLGLAVFDLVFVLCGVPVHISPIFGLENWLYAWLYAYFLYPFTAVSLTGSIYMTMAVTIER